MLRIPPHLLNFLLAVDRLVNTVWRGKPNETISGTVGRAAAAGDWWATRLAQPFVNWLMGNPTHCQEQAALEAEQSAG